MKYINITIMLIAIFTITEQSLIAYNTSANDYQPTHQGLGRFGTAIENTLTLHPGNAINALATGNQADTTFGWHQDKNNRIKANRAHTRHNNNRHERHDEARYDNRHNEHYNEISKETLKKHKQTHEQQHENERESNKEKKSRRWFW